MKDIADKVNDAVGDTGRLPDEEYNDHKNEIQKAVENSGQTLAQAKTNQFSQALFANGVNSPSVKAGGTVNAIALTLYNGNTTLALPESYSLLNGAIFLFNAAGVNTITGVTIAISQDAVSLAASPLVNSDGSSLAVGQVNGLCIVRYNNDDTRWELLSSQPGSLTFKKIINIGDWNMDTTDGIAIAHGLTFSKIRRISALIRNDTDSIYYEFTSLASLAAEDVTQNITTDSTNINLYRDPDGLFDSTFFDSTSYNRGWITIEYIL